MRALIVDDEAPARAKIRRLLTAAGGVEIVGEAATGREAVAAIKRTRPDIVFLDIQMPGLDGFGVVDAIDRDGGPYVVFVTAHDQHAMRAFEVGAVDYLLKPFTPGPVRPGAGARPRAAPDRRFGGAEMGRTPAQPGPDVSAPHPRDRHDGRALFLPWSASIASKAERNYVVLQSGADAVSAARDHRVVGRAARSRRSSCASIARRSSGSTPFVRCTSGRTATSAS